MMRDGEKTMLLLFVHLFHLIFWHKFILLLSPNGESALISTWRSRAATKRILWKGVANQYVSREEMIMIPDTQMTLLHWSFLLLASSLPVAFPYKVRSLLCPCANLVKTSNLNNALKNKNPTNVNFDIWGKACDAQNCIFRWRWHYCTLCSYQSPGPILLN